MAERAYERFAWIILFLVAVIFALFGLGDIILGTAADPAIVEGIAGMTPEEVGAADPRLLLLVDQQVRAGGAAFMVYGILAAAIAWTSYRGGERWAWYVLWTLPLLNVLIFLNMYTSTDFSAGVLPPPLQSAPRLPGDYGGGPPLADPAVLPEGRIVRPSSTDASVKSREPPLGLRPLTLRTEFPPQRPRALSPLVGTPVPPTTPRPAIAHRTR